MMLHDMLEIPNEDVFASRNPPGLMVGIDAIDGGINGLQAGVLHILFSPVGIGASTLLIKMCLDVSQHAGIAFISEGGVDDVRDAFLRLRSQLPQTSPNVFDAKIQKRLNDWLRYPVSVIGNTQTIEALQANTLAAMMEVRRTGYRTKLLVVDCPKLFAVANPDRNRALTYLRKLAKRGDVAIVVNYMCEVPSKDGENVCAAFGRRQGINEHDDSQHPKPKGDPKAAIEYQIGYLFVLRKRILDGEPMGEEAGNRVFHTTNCLTGQGEMQVLTIMPSVGICEETALTDDPDPDMVSFDP